LRATNPQVSAGKEKCLTVTCEVVDSHIIPGTQFFIVKVLCPGNYVIRLNKWLLIYMRIKA
jgi:hypothetical protein